ncbi:MAG: chitobiase/beta-hexosaminidase C-terminal domain-containing protein, partial [Gammaproteobacteria bacterium]|nr:chitobiase/beta-hexosaminidase C-terminal domain-containing protein [Gammaproteobacteria bacterium]
MSYEVLDTNRHSIKKVQGWGDMSVYAKTVVTVLSVWVSGLMLSPAHANVVISEFMASNDLTLDDEDGNSSDWIELHNTGVVSVNLGGWFLTDDDQELDQWQLPSVSLAPDAYLTIFASSKDRTGAELHTNFKLSAGGEYLALVQADGVTVVDEIAPEYPQQYTDVSWGLSASGYRYFNEPTPGGANSEGFDGVVDIDVTGERGFYSTAQTINLASSTTGATIRYTLDGTDPRGPTASIYTAPLSINRTTVLRAVAVRDDYIDSRVETHTLIFVSDVVDQTTMSRLITQSPQYQSEMQASLTSLPSISVVTRNVLNPELEVEASLEWLTPDNSDSFQLNAGVRYYGGSSLYSLPKNHIRMYFRGRYGAKKLEYPLFDGHDSTIEAVDEFDQLHLRSGSHDTPFWVGAGSNFETRGSYLRSRWSDDAMLAMGHKTTHGRYVHVYYNGVYWGQHHLRERFNDDFLASYFGGDSSEYEMVNNGIASDGDGSTWETIKTLRTDWQQVKAYLDDEQFVDYILLNLYAGNLWDWWHDHNWRAGGFDGIAEPGWQFFNPDQDLIFQDPGNNLWDSSQCQLRPTCTDGPDFLWRDLRSQGDPDLKVLFADRVYEHFFNDGVLTPAVVDSMWTTRHDQIESSMVAETARWGNGQLWQQVRTDIAHVSFGMDGSMWGVDANNNTYRRRNLASNWEAVTGQYVRIDALDYNRAIALTSANTIFYYDGAQWIPLSGTMVDVSYGIDGSVWAVSPAGTTFRRRSVDPADSWENMSLSSASIDALDYERAVNTTNSQLTYHYDGTQWIRLRWAVWQDVSYGKDGSIWGVETDGSIWRRKRPQRAWTDVAGNFDQIDVLYWDQVVGVMSNNTAHHYSGTDYDYQRDDEWDTEMIRLRQNYFPQRTATVLQQIRDEGWYPDIDPPTIDASTAGSAIMNNPNASGDIVYTTDGSDPRLAGGTVSSVAITCAVPCSPSFAVDTSIIARVKDGGEWSAFESADIVGLPISTPNVSVNDLNVAESVGDATVSVVLDQVSSQVVTVDYTTSQSNPVEAQSNIDYTTTTGTLTFIPGDVSEDVLIPIIDDTQFEVSEDFELVLQNPVNATITTGTATITIADDDSSGYDWTIGVVDSVSYGNYWGDSGWNTLPSLSRTFEMPDNPTVDLVLTLDTFDLDPTPNEISVSLNGTVIGDLPDGLNETLITGVTFVIPASSLATGSNTIEFTNVNPAYKWGITNAVLDYVTAGADWTIAVADPVSYGNNWGDPGTDNLSSLTRTFDVPDNPPVDLLLTLDTFDLDPTPNEISVSVNGTSIGDLPDGINETLVTGVTFQIPSTALVTGLNTIVFTNVNPAYKWGMTNAVLTYASTGSDWVIGTSDPTEYGKSWGDTGWNNIGSLARTFDVPDTPPETLILTLDTYDIDPVPNEISVKINGVVVGDLPDGVNDTLVTGVTFTIPSSSLTTGQNTIEFTNINPAYKWGITNAVLNYQSGTSNWTIGTIDSVQYGNNWGDPGWNMLATLSRTFDVPDAPPVALTLTVDTFDLDPTPNEISVTVNGAVVGDLPDGINET